jgi:hypothetical protein
MKFRAMAPDPLTGRLIPYRGTADIAIEFTAANQAEANRLARLNKLPPAVFVVPDEPTPKLNHGEGSYEAIDRESERTQRQESRWESRKPFAHGRRKPR